MNTPREGMRIFGGDEKIRYVKKRSERDVARRDAARRDAKAIHARANDERLLR